MTPCCWRGDCALATYPSASLNCAPVTLVHFEFRLINHFKVEEELLFPAFREVLGVEASLIEVLLSDHQELRAQAAAIKAGANDLVDNFCVLLERHIRAEERQLFELVQESDEAGKDGGAGAADKSAT